MQSEPSPPSGLVGEKEIAMGPEEQSIQSRRIGETNTAAPLSVSANPAAMEPTSAQSQIEVASPLMRLIEEGKLDPCSSSLIALISSLQYYR
jgi:hypothetical protein